MKTLLIACVFVCVLVSGSLGTNENLMKLAEQLGATTLVQLVRRAGLEGTLSGGVLLQGPFTIFAPTNAAFDALPKDILEKLSTDMTLLKQVLAFHVTIGQVYSSELTNNMLLQTQDPTDKIRVNIYQKSGSTIVTVDGAQVTMVDQNATNGVIHVIDHVMYPLPTQTIPMVAASAKQFGTLVYALQQGQLLSALQGTGPFTVFAPNNAAFDKLPPNALSDLLSNQTALVAVLKYHVVAAADYSAGLSSGPVTTLEGRSVQIGVSTDGVMVNTAKVVTADIPAANGVIHEIDTVLLPPN